MREFVFLASLTFLFQKIVSLGDIGNRYRAYRQTMLLKHKCCTEIEVQRTIFEIGTTLGLALYDIDKAMLKAHKELPLAPQLYAEIVVKTKIKTLVKIVNN